MVVGVERLAYRIHGDTCGGPDIYVPPNITNEYSNNEAHSVLSGVNIFPSDKGFIYDRSRNITSHFFLLLCLFFRMCFNQRIQVRMKNVNRR